ncbi:hypothetical protein KCP73_12900 [Salmonella enterica subsp. enterica]|nr:hypothetical protein KCP73_12900 [Salmonella enterica subsp. enterica]
MTVVCVGTVAGCAAARTAQSSVSDYVPWSSHRLQRRPLRLCYANPISIGLELMVTGCCTTSLITRSYGSGSGR